MPDLIVGGRLPSQTVPPPAPAPVASLLEERLGIVPGIRVVDMSAALEMRRSPSTFANELVGKPINAAKAMRDCEEFIREFQNDAYQQGAFINRINTNLNMTTGTLTMTGDLIWPAWNSSTINSTAAITSGTNDLLVWTAWNSTTATTYGSNSFTVHYSWNEWNRRRQEEALGFGFDAQAAIARNARPSDEEVKRRLESNRRWQEESQARAAAAQLIQDKAERILRSCLTAQQLEDLEKKNSFYVEIPRERGKPERYRIDRGSHGNIKQLDEKGSVIRAFCVQPEGIPVGDILLAQKLYLESSEETRDKLWATANLTEYQGKTIPSHIPREQRRQYAIHHGLLH